MYTIKGYRTAMVGNSQIAESTDKISAKDPVSLNV
jgi:hypothetical protein